MSCFLLLFATIGSLIPFCNTFQGSLRRRSRRRSHSSSIASLCHIVLHEHNIAAHSGPTSGWRRLRRVGRFGRMPRWIGCPEEQVGAGGESGGGEGVQVRRERGTVIEAEEASYSGEKCSVSVELACSATSESERTTCFFVTATALASSSPPPPRARSPKTRLPVLPQVILLRMVGIAKQHQTVSREERCLRGRVVRGCQGADWSAGQQQEQREAAGEAPWLTHKQPQVHLSGVA